MRCHLQSTARRQKQMCSHHLHPSCFAASSSEEMGEWSGEDHLCEKRRSTSVGEQGSCPSSEDTKPLRVQPLRGQRPDMRLTPRARPIHAEGTFEHTTFETTRLEISQEFAIFFSLDGRRGNRPLAGLYSTVGAVKSSVERVSLFLFSFLQSQ